MNIEYAIRKRTHEIGAQQTHEASQTNQLHFVRPQFVDQHPVVSLALHAGGSDRTLRNPSLPGDFKSRRVRAVADDNSNLSVPLPARDVVRDGFEVRPAA